MASQVFDLRTSRGMTRAQSNEHLRNFSERAFNEKMTRNFDPTRQRLNFEITKGGEVAPVNKRLSVDERIRMNLQERGIKDPNEGLPQDSPKRRTTVIDIILQGSRDRMRELAFGNQVIDEGGDGRYPDNSHIERKPEIEDWAKDMYAFMCKRFGEENIAAFVVHLDEKNPHVHCTLIPTGMIKGKLRISSSSIFGKNKYEAKATMRKLHDDLAEVNKKWGLERGRDIRETGAKHRTTEEYWKWLSDTCTELENQTDGQRRELALLNKELKKAETRVKGLSSMVNNLQDKKSQLEQEYNALESDFIILDMEKESVSEEKYELQKNMDMIKEEIRRIDESIQDKREKLEKAESQLEEIRSMQASLEREVADLSKKKNNLTHNVQDMSVQMAMAMAWNFAKDAVQELKIALDDTIESSSGETKRTLNRLKEETFDASFLDEMAEHAEQIVSVSVALFLGYLDEATQFAHSVGGGGGNTGGWGREKDEDEWDFMRRCFGKARQMLKRSSGRKR